MGDEEIFSEEDVSGGDELEVGKKGGFLPAIVLVILKWVAIALVAVIFIVTIVYFTMKVMNKGTVNQSYPAVSEEYQGKIPVYEWYEIDEIRGRTADIPPATVIVRAKLGYDKDDKDMQTDLIARTEQIYDFMRRYFSTKTSAELTPQTEAEVKMDLKEGINRIMAAGKVREIVFYEYNVFEF